MSVKDALAKVFFLICAAMTVFYLIAGYGAYLDSDMSSELVLAEHLASLKNVVSPEWYYSTEIRLINTQLIFTPLMALFSNNWRLVRTLGCIILLSILAASCIYAAKEAGAQKHYAYILAGLSISIISPIYAQNVIIGAYYIPHAVLALWLSGTYERWIHKGGALLLSIVLCLAFVMGLSSVRYLLFAILPLICGAVWQFVFVGEEELKRTKAQWRLLGAGVGIAILGITGYVIGKITLPKYFNISTDYYGSMGYASFSQHDLLRQFQTVVYGLINAIGFQEAVPVFGVQGILNALVLLEVVVAGMLIWRTLQRERKEIENTSIYIFLFAIVLSLGAFVLLRSVYFDRYWLPVMMMGAPVMALCFSKEHNPYFRRLALCLFAGATLLTSMSCMYYSMRNPQVDSEQRMSAVEIAREKGITRGYATFWNANVLTKLSNGELDVTAITLSKDEKGDCVLAPNRWLELENDYMKGHLDDPVFLLIGTWEIQDTEQMLQRLQAQRVESDGWIDFYIIPTQAILLAEMKLI